MDKKYIRDDWVDKFWMNLNKTSQMLRAAFNEVVDQTEHQILAEHWVILMSIYQKGPLTQIEIARLNYKHTPSISRSLNHLEKRGLLIRKSSKEDKRFVKVHLQPSGIKLIEDLYPAVLAVRIRSWASLSKKDFDHMHETLKKVQSNLQKEFE
ncbi:MAG: MarR family transcriptional regulator [Bacteroidota bacterium]